MPYCRVDQQDLGPLCSVVAGCLHWIGGIGGGIGRGLQRRRQVTRCAGDGIRSRHALDARRGRRWYPPAGNGSRRPAATTRRTSGGGGGGDHPVRPPEPPPVGEHRPRSAPAAGGAGAAGEVHGGRVPAPSPTTASSLLVSETLRADYQTAAEALAQQVARDPAALGRLVPGLAATPAADLKDRARWRSSGTSDGAPTGGRWTTRRWPRSPPCSTRARRWSPGADAFAAGAQLVLEAMLQSPHFLYRTELTTGHGPGATGRLRDRRQAVLRPGRHHARR